jgi:hypothetical protein
MKRTPLTSKKKIQEKITQIESLLANTTPNTTTHTFLTSELKKYKLHLFL